MGKHSGSVRTFVCFQNFIDHDALSLRIKNSGRF
jgi:hypothetical protein